MAQQSQRPTTNRVSCFICGGPHYAKECPLENQKTARGYTAQIAEDEAPDPINDSDREHHPPDESPGEYDDHSLEPEIKGSDKGDCDSHPEGDQYDPDEVKGHPFSSDDEFEPVHSQATRIITTSALKSCAAKALKAMPLKTTNMESH